LITDLLKRLEPAGAAADPTGAYAALTRDPASDHFCYGTGLTNRALAEQHHVPAPPAVHRGEHLAVMQVQRRAGGARRQRGQTVQVVPDRPPRRLRSFVRVVFL